MKCYCDIIMSNAISTDRIRHPLGPARRSACRRPASTLLPLLLALALPFHPVAAQTVETTLLDPDFEMASGGDVAAAPGHGYVAVWSRGMTETVAGGAVTLVPDRVMSVWLAPDGSPLTPSRALDQPDDDIGAPLAVASATPGGAVVALETTSGLETRRFRFDGSAPDPLQAVSSCDTGTDSAELVAAGQGYWLAWYESCGEAKLLVRRLGLSGAPEGPAVEIAEPGDRLHLRFGAAATPDGGFWVAWDQLTPGEEAPGRAIMARRYGPDGAPATEPVELRKFFPDRDELSTDLAALPDGGALVSWRDRTDRIFLRRIGADGVPAGPPTQASAATAVRELWPQVASSGLGVSAATWLRVTPGSAPSQCVLRLFDTVRPQTGEEVELDSSCSPADELVFGADGSLFVLTHEAVPLPSGAFVTLDYPRPRIVVLPASETAGPPGSGFVSQAVPGFRIWARIGGDEPTPRIGRPEASCLPETACVSGAIPGRSEVFVRMVGPKPNGYLWPTIVRFTTSTVEVWIEQLSTGELRYYRLEGATPGSSDLTGRFDRMGFMP